MDLNELLFHHQLALIGEAGDRSQGQAPRRSLVRHYADRLSRLRQELGVPAYSWATAEREA